MKISILSPDLSGNALGRAYLLAKILQRRYEVEIVGPIFDTGIWQPVADDKSITYKSVKLYGRFKPYWKLKELTEKIDGDVIYASKPLFTSFGIGLLEKINNKKPLILDIDDWELGLTKEKYNNMSSFSCCLHLASSTLHLYRIRSYWNNLLCEKFVKFADDITVSNTFLKNKFGGSIIFHGRNTVDFDPVKFDKAPIKEKLNIPINKRIIIFFGSPRPHKGIEDLVTAIQMIRSQDIILVLVGIDNTPYSYTLIKAATKKLKKKFKVFGLQSFDTIPEFLSIADVVVIPQKKNLATLGQMPAKVFDAMAMAKAIITTNVSDLPKIIDGCGWIVEPTNPEQLAETIQHVLDNPKEAKIAGINARKKCEKHYSWDAIAETLLAIFEKYK